MNTGVKKNDAVKKRLERPLEPGETEWLDSFNNRIKFREKHIEQIRKKIKEIYDDSEKGKKQKKEEIDQEKKKIKKIVNLSYRYKNSVRNKINSLPRNFHLFSLKEINGMIRASKRPEMKIDFSTRELISKILPNTMLKLLAPFNSIDKIRFLKTAENILSLQSKEIASYNPLLEMLSKVNTHPGISYWDLDFIFDELGMDPADMNISTKDNGSCEITNSIAFDKIRKISKKELKSAVKNVISVGKWNFEYWSFRKFHSDKNFLLKNKRRAFKILEELDKIKKENEIGGLIKKETMKRLDQRRKTTYLKEMYMRGLITEINKEKKLDRFEVIKIYKEKCLKLVKKCKFHKSGFVNDENELLCSNCIKDNGKIFKKLSLLPKHLQLTEYGKEMLIKLS